jgi:hypothetical protein
MTTLKVCAQKCDQCLFSSDRIVSKKRMNEILRECERTDSHFVCHKTDDAVCAGFYNSRSTNLIRIMQRLNGIEKI